MAVNRRMPRIQSVVLPILRDGLADDWPGVKIGSWVEDVDRRTFPLINVRRLGGFTVDVEMLDRPVIEMTAYSADGLVPTEKLMLDARTVLYRAVLDQTVVPGVGYLHSYFETLSPSQFDSPYEDTWRIQGLIQLGLRPTRV